MSDVIHYPLYITTPEKIEITAEQFQNLSYYGLSSFLVSWALAIEKRPDGGLFVWGGEGRLYQLFETPRFKGTKFLRYGGSEMIKIEIPAGHALVNTFTKYFSRYFFLES